MLTKDKPRTQGIGALEGTQMLSDLNRTEQTIVPSWCGREFVRITIMIHGPWHGMIILDPIFAKCVDVLT